MTKDIPEERVDAKSAETLWRRIRTNDVPFFQRAWRLRERQEDWGETIARDGIRLVGAGVQLGNHFFAWLSDLSG